MKRGKTLITGGAGFIGSHLVRRMFDQGDDVIVLDNLHPQIHGKDGSSSTYNSILGKCTFIKGDVQNPDDWKKAITGVENIVHLAAETGTGQSMYMSEHYTSVNCVGTSILTDLLSSGLYNIKNVVLASSRAIYGEGKYECPLHGTLFPFGRDNIEMKKGQFDCFCSICNSPVQPMPTDENSIINPLSIYGLTKYFQERILITACSALNITFTALRFQNVFGPGQSLINPYTGIISIFTNLCKEDKRISIFEDGNESRDFVYIDDIVQSMILSIDLQDKKNRILNVGTGNRITVLEVAETLKTILNSKSDIVVTGQFRQGDIRHNFADISSLKKELGFTPNHTFKEGITKFIEWAKSENGATDGYEKSLHELTKKGLLVKSS